MGIIDYLLIALLLLVASWAVRKVIRTRKQGGCGCGCQHCSEHCKKE